MSTDELIRKLRWRAEGDYSADETMELLNEAADRLEELDERVAIMMEGADEEKADHAQRRAQDAGRTVQTGVSTDLD